MISSASLSSGSSGGASTEASTMLDPLLLLLPELAGVVRHECNSSPASRDCAAGGTTGGTSGGGCVGDGAACGLTITPSSYSTPTHRQQQPQQQPQPQLLPQQLLGSMRQCRWSFAQPAGEAAAAVMSSLRGSAGAAPACCNGRLTGPPSSSAAAVSEGGGGGAEFCPAARKPLVTSTVPLPPFAASDICTPTRARLCEQYPDVLQQLKMRQLHEASPHGAQALRAAIDQALRTAAELRTQNQRLRAALQRKASAGHGPPSLPSQQRQHQSAAGGGTGEAVCGSPPQTPTLPTSSRPPGTDAQQQEVSGPAAGPAAGCNNAWSPADPRVRSCWHVACGGCSACGRAGSASPKSTFAPAVGHCGTGAIAGSPGARSPVTPQGALQEQPLSAARQRRFSWRRLRSCKSEAESALTSYLEMDN